MISLCSFYHHVNRIIIAKVARYRLCKDVSHRVPIIRQPLPAGNVAAALDLRIEQISGGIVGQCHVGMIIIAGNAIYILIRE